MKKYFIMAAQAARDVNKHDSEVTNKRSGTSGDTDSSSGSDTKSYVVKEK
jgi:hypothetical protein